MVWVDGNAKPLFRDGKGACDMTTLPAVYDARQEKRNSTQ